MLQIWNFPITDSNDSLEIIHLLLIWQFMVSSDTFLPQYAEKFMCWNIGRDYLMKMRIYLSIWEKPIYLQILRS